jgi:hypothetical protein
MNIFYLHPDPKQCAQEHCDKHVVKMVIEYAQLLSTCHRVLDGTSYIGKTKTGRKAKRWSLPDGRDDHLYLASHVKHPDEIWLQQSCGNYQYLYELFSNLCDEYTRRYGKVHETDRKLRNILALHPENIPCGEMTEPPQCMPEYCKTDEPISAYKNYYINEKKRFAKWTKRPEPQWFVDGVAA